MRNTMHSLLNISLVNVERKRIFNNLDQGSPMKLKAYIDTVTFQNLFNLTYCKLCYDKFDSFNVDIPLSVVALQIKDKLYCDNVLVF